MFEILKREEIKFSKDTKFLNLMGRTANAIAAIHFLEEGYPKQFEKYAKAFTSITEKEIEDAFSFLIPEAKLAIVKKVELVQGKIKKIQEVWNRLEDTEKVNANESTLKDLKGIQSMLHGILSL